MSGESTNSMSRVSCTGISAYYARSPEAQPYEIGDAFQPEYQPPPWYGLQPSSEIARLGGQELLHSQHEIFAPLSDSHTISSPHQCHPWCGGEEMRPNGPSLETDYLEMCVHSVQPQAVDTTMRGSVSAFVPQRLVHA